MYDNYTTIAKKASKLEEFSGNTMRGEWDIVTAMGLGTDTSKRRFTVYSYRTVIGEVTIEGDSVSVYINPQKYSVTTSKQQNILRRAWEARFGLVNNRRAI